MARNREFLSAILWVVVVAPLSASSELPDSPASVPPLTVTNESKDLSASEGYEEEVKRMRAGIGGEQSSDFEPEDSNRAQNYDEQATMKTRIITGIEGLPFSNPEQIVLEPTPTATLPPAPEPPPATPTPWQHPQRCLTNETIKEALVAETDRQEILNDTLFLPEDYIPIDMGEVYGNVVSFYPYGPSQGAGQFVSQEVFKVPCLPYRIRQTTWGRYLHFGHDALKHYEDSGKDLGKFHPWVEQRLFGATQRRVRRR